MVSSSSIQDFERGVHLVRGEKGLPQLGVEAAEQAVLRPFAASTKPAYSTPCLFAFFRFTVDKIRTMQGMSLLNA